MSCPFVLRAFLFLPSRAKLYQLQHFYGICAKQTGFRKLGEVFSAAVVGTLFCIGRNTRIKIVRNGNSLVVDDAEELLGWPQARILDQVGRFACSWRRWGVSFAQDKQSRRKNHVQLSRHNDTGPTHVTSLGPKMGPREVTCQPQKELLKLTSLSVLSIRQARLKVNYSLLRYRLSFFFACSVSGQSRLVRRKCHIYSNIDWSLTRKIGKNIIGTISLK